MIKEIVIERIKAFGWVLGYGLHYHKICNVRDRQTGELKTRPFRIQVRHKSIRMEALVDKKWVKIESAYYTQIELMEDGRLKFGSKILG